MISTLQNLFNPEFWFNAFPLLIGVGILSWIILGMPYAPGIRGRRPGIDE